MNAVELVKSICKAQKISIAKLERDCDFSNGYISKLKGDTFPVDRAKKIADYLGIEVELLIGLDKIDDDSDKRVYYIDDKSVEIARKIFENPELRALFDVASDSRPEDLQMASDLLRRFKETSCD